MKAPRTSTVLSMAALSSSALAAVTINIAKNPEAQLRRRDLSARASTITESLVNNNTGGDYIAEVSVGTPPQKITLAIDTGSSDVWLLSSNADLCTNATLQDYYQTGGCASTFDSSKSSSFKVVDKGGFAIQYADQSGALGDYITDTFSIGGATIKTLEMGLAYNASLQTGLLGIGYDTNEASNDPQIQDRPFSYPSIIDSMVSQGLINTKAYSLYLDDLEASTGSIIFGGLDSDKYHGTLLQIPLVPDLAKNGSKIYAEFGVALSGFSITGDSGNTSTLTTSSFQEDVILDSGTTLTFLPDKLVTMIYKVVQAYDDSQGTTGIVFVDCGMRSSGVTFNYGFGGAEGVTIKVPASELIFDLTADFSTEGVSPPFANACAFGIMPGGTEADGPFILGDTFLRSAYVVYDLKNNAVALAQTNFNSTTSSIVDFQASATSIPNVSGVASSPGVTETSTPTGILGIGIGTKTGSGNSGQTSSTAAGSDNGGVVTAVPTASGTGTSSSSSSSSSSSTSKSAAVGAVPAFGMRGMLVLGIASVFAILGGGLVLA